MNELKHKRLVIYIGLLPVFILWILFSLRTPARAEQALLKKYIIEFNLKALENSFADHSYRGEEGILALDPEDAKSLGMKVVIDDDYLESMKLFDEAEKELAKAKQAMTLDAKESSPGYYAKEISENFLGYKKDFMEAEKRLQSYHSRLNREKDDRLNESVCAKIIDKTLDDLLKDAEKGLRDKLAMFYNICHGINNKTNPLTEKNVRFVNYVFSGFLKEASPDERKMYNLDSDRNYADSGSNWKDAAGLGTSEYVVLLEASIKKLGNSIYPVDPLLFMALMKRESGFDPLAVSGVGAAGLTQIMPETAKSLGMSNIFMPEYFNEAVSLIKKERDARNKALSTLNEIKDENGLKVAEQARSLMQESLELGRKKADLFEKYEKDLLKNQNDDRLQASISIEYGLKYFAGLMKRNNGDISLALASYNAGENKVKDFDGIPPYKETIGFRNKVLQYYGEFREKILNK